jgi:hypothetical protein
MSLKAFHVFFIFISLACCGFTAVWAGQRVAAGMDSGSLAVAIASGAVFTLGVPYLGWFLRKSKSFR